MDQAGGIAGNPNEQKESLRNVVEMVKSMSNKNLDLLRPSARYYTGSKDTSERERGKYTLIKDAEDGQFGLYDKPLPCFGCGVGWFSFLMVGFICPLMWYYAIVLYFGNFYRKDPRERGGLAASAISAMMSTVLLLVIGAYFCLQGDSRERSTTMLSADAVIARKQTNCIAV